MSLKLEEAERFRLYRLTGREKERLLKELREFLAKRGEILLAIVFGSFLKDRPFRDIDLAVYVAGDPDPLSYKLGLEAEVERSVKYPADVVVLNSTPPWFTMKVLKEGKELVVRASITEKLYLKAVDEEQLTTNRLVKS